MIDLPSWPAPQSCSPALLDWGGVARPGGGARIQKVNRMGSRFRVSIGWPPLPAGDTGRVFVARLLRAKREGARIEFPLLGVDQGLPGSPVVDGAGQAGLTLNVRGLTPSYCAREGFWLSIVDAAGQHYLHCVTAVSIADATGDAALSIEPMLRVPFADGAAVHLGKPMIEGLLDGDEISWDMSLAHHIGISATIEEAA